MFLLAQASDLIYLFLLMYLDEHIFRFPKEMQYGTIFLFLLIKISFLYFYINEEKYDTKTFVSLRFFTFLIPLFCLIGEYLKIPIIIYTEKVLLLLFLISLVFKYTRLLNLEYGELY
ncbi:hypothetical protein [Fusobacterium polymorphum]|uniref:hypothetical protein n=1 Tax=Fusobacterium nucleatum subsp. polymorphum TaxID=76857 RepID=UPI0021C257ED|nr:hypothetical protein [Fusobacterium polymorphum]